MEEESIYLNLGGKLVARIAVSGVAVHKTSVSGGVVEGCGRGLPGAPGLLPRQLRLQQSDLLLHGFELRLLSRTSRLPPATCSSPSIASYYSNRERTNSKMKMFSVQMKHLVCATDKRVVYLLSIEKMIGETLGPKFDSGW